MRGPLIRTLHGFVVHGRHHADVRDCKVFQQDRFSPDMRQHLRAGLWLRTLAVRIDHRYVVTRRAGHDSHRGGLGVAHLLGEPAPPARPRGRPGPQRYDRAFFEEIAALYREGLLRRPGNPYMREKRPGSLPTQRRWVHRARKMGLLGSGASGKAGDYSKRTSEDPHGNDHEAEQ